MGTLIIMFYYYPISSQIGDKGCLLTLSLTASVTVGTSCDVISFERRMKSLETENRELVKISDRIDGSAGSPSSDEVKKLVDQVQALTKQNQGL